MNINIDDKDLKILSILQSNGRIAISELATRLNMSDTPCLRRVKKLEQAGVISGYSAQINPDGLGLNAMVYVFISYLNCQILLKSILRMITMASQ